MATAVLLFFADRGKEFVDDAHVHGFRDGQLLIARGAPGGGIDADIVRTVTVADLVFAETCERNDTDDDESTDEDSDGPDWSITW